jgi:hypothetical protein
MSSSQSHIKNGKSCGEEQNLAKLPPGLHEQEVWALVKATMSSSQSHIGNGRSCGRGTKPRQIKTRLPNNITRTQNLLIWTQTNNHCTMDLSIVIMSTDSL